LREQNEGALEQLLVFAESLGYTRHYGGNVTHLMKRGYLHLSLWSEDLSANIRGGRNKLRGEASIRQYLETYQ